jgi:hypothetical protein
MVLKEFYLITPDVPFHVYIFEKPNVNRLADGSLTKDGIHMVIGMQVDHTMQLIIRDRMIKKLEEIWDLPLINNWDSVLDEGISTGKTGWQLFGSRKPGHEAYELTHHYIMTLDGADNNFTMDEKDVSKFDLKRDFEKLSVRYENNQKFEINPKIIDEYNMRLHAKGHKMVKKASSRTKMNLIIEDDEDDLDEQISINDIKDNETLDKAVSLLLKNLKENNQYEVVEIHQFAQALPEKYYEPGSHVLNRQVAFALKHTDERLFLSWVQLRSKASDFDFSTIPDLYHQWKTYFYKRPDGITKKSIIYWAKQDAFEEYEKVKRNTIDYYIEETIFEAGDWDYAMVLYHMFKDKYVCSSIPNKKWYVFRNHRWEKDEGQRLRMAISKDLFQLYSDKQSQYLSDSHHYQANEDGHENYQRKVKKIAEICIKLKKTNDKNNIMREAMEIFFDPDFTKQIDSNPHLLCFNNGVFDFKNKEFRQGYPHDYISKTTGVNYIAYDYNSTKEISDDIMNFMDKLFPLPDLCRYMWDHLSSCLIGIKKEHAFNIYPGSGSNGKALLTDLMSQALGENKGTVPITLVTEKRGSIGGTSSEVIQLKGVRYAVMQEPSKDAVINEGILKELTGGDPIQARALYSDSEVFIPQFSLVVCTNALFDVKSNDDGTWR